ncbi:MAG: FAD-binding oxidoreductase [Candidatus Eisenbacteria bacterium]|nr:FAD-binding oxidoreductase [Candidatus Eisenbacteria bacterium]
MKRTADCVIVGGGVIGCALAYYLAREGMTDCLVLEASHLAAGGTGRCGGGIRQQWSTEENARFAIASVRAFEALSEELGTDIEFLQGGYLVLAYTDEDVDQFRRNVELQRSLGLDVEVLTPADVRRTIAPMLNTDGLRLATHCATDGSANPFLTTAAYANAARRLGAEIELYTPVRKLLVDGGRVRGVETDRGAVSAPIVVNAAGSHSVLLARTVGVELPITPYRREILVTEPLERFFDPMIISFSFGIYFRQTRHGSVIGGFADPEQPGGFDETSSLDFLVTMSKKLAHLMPALESVKVVRQWAGLYDATPDARPLLGRTDGVEGLHQANGFSGHGFMIAPAVTRSLAQSIAGKRPDIDIEPLNLRRFAEGRVKTERSVV